jgi:serine/threonine-protein kinase RsbW
MTETLPVRPAAAGGSPATGSPASERERVIADVARLRLSRGPLLGPVLWRVVSIVLAQADWPLDRLDEALLVCDTLCAHAPEHARGDTVSFSVRADERKAELRVLDLTDGGAEGLVRDAILPVVGNVLETIADSVSIELGEPGEGSQLALVLSASS